MAVQAAVALGTEALGYQVYSGQKKQKAQKTKVALQAQANEEAKVRTQTAADRTEIEQNKANSKRAQVSANHTKEEQTSRK